MGLKPIVQLYDINSIPIESKSVSLVYDLLEYSNISQKCFLFDSTNCDLKLNDFVEESIMSCLKNGKFHRIGIIDIAHDLNSPILHFEKQYMSGSNRVYLKYDFQTGIYKSKQPLFISTHHSIIDSCDNMILQMSYKYLTYNISVVLMIIQKAALYNQINLLKDSLCKWYQIAVPECRM